MGSLGQNILMDVDVFFDELGLIVEAGGGGIWSAGGMLVMRFGMYRFVVEAVISIRVYVLFAHHL